MLSHRTELGVVSVDHHRQRVWLFSFVGFFWWYSDPSMNMVQSIIQKEYFKDGFV